MTARTKFPQDWQEVRPLLYGLIGICIATIVLLLLYSVISTRQLAGAIREGQINNKSTFALLQDCVVPSPDHKCFLRSQRNQKGILGVVQMQQVAAVACGDAPGYQSPQEINACVNRTMKALSKR